MYKVIRTKETSKYATVLFTMAQCHFCSFLEINSTRNEKFFKICLNKTSVHLQMFLKIFSNCTEIQSSQ